MSRSAVAGIAAIGISAAVVGCGGTGSSSTATTSAQGSSIAASSQPVVFAAASLSRVFPKIDPSATYAFGGSGALQTQIEQGAPADVFAAASAKQPAALSAMGMVDTPVKFATNRLVLIVPKGNPAHIASVGDITKPGVKLVICAESVPCGDYARNVFKNLNITASAMRNVVSNASDVTQVVAQVAVGQADAGFVYVTDAQAANGKVTVIPLPVAAKPLVTDYIAVVRSGKNQAGATRFVRTVLSPPGQATLRAAGFGAP